MAKREIPKGFPLLGQPDFSRRSEFYQKLQNTTKSSFSYHQGSELSARCSLITDWLLTDCNYSICRLTASWLLTLSASWQLRCQRRWLLDTLFAEEFEEAATPLLPPHFSGPQPYSSATGPLMQTYEPIRRSL